MEIRLPNKFTYLHGKKQQQTKHTCQLMRRPKCPLMSIHPFSEGRANTETNEYTHTCGQFRVADWQLTTDNKQLTTSKLHTEWD